MAFCRSVLVLSVLCLLHSVTASQVPVFLWGDLATTSIKSNPLGKVSDEYFRDIIKQELKNDPFTVIMMEETLSVEDFSLKNGDGESSYPYLHANIGKSVYLPSVDAALQVLDELADPEKVDNVELTEDGLTAEIEPESGKFLFINLKDAKEGESRVDLLRRHNDFMEDMFSKLKKRYTNVVAIYTAHFPSWTIPESHSRVRRQTETQLQGLYQLDDLLLYVNKLEYHDGNNTIPLSGTPGTSVFKNNTELEASLTFGERKVTLFFNNAAGYWFFNKVSVEEGGLVEHLEPTEQAVYALDGFSYRCAQSISFASINTTKAYSLTFGDIKVQPFTGNATEFSESLNCVGFFSVPIWSGLFVVFILLAITFYGIMMMMDIRTMDRFDDPKGKTITINAGE